MREYLESLNGAVQIEQLSGYAPELNPTEYIWGRLNNHELVNHCASTFGELKTRARNRLRSMQRRPTLIRAFWLSIVAAKGARFSGCAPESGAERESCSTR